MVEPGDNRSCASDPIVGGDSAIDCCSRSVGTAVDHGLPSEPERGKLPVHERCVFCDVCLCVCVSVVSVVVCLLSTMFSSRRKSSTSRPQRLHPSAHSRSLRV